MNRAGLSLALMALCAASPAGATPSLEQDVVRELNFARTQPRAYARTLRQYREAFRGLVVNEAGEGPGVLTFEGAAAVDEAIALLERQAPLPPLDDSDRLARAAGDQRDDQAGGAVGHRGADGSMPTTRIERYAHWSGQAAEAISYGADTGQGVVRQLIIDDGVPARGHRRTLFSPVLTIVGAACGPHRLYGHMCVLDFATKLSPLDPGRGSR